jgi:DNA repair protein RadC
MNTIKTEQKAIYNASVSIFDTDDQIILKALAILQSRMKIKGIELTSPGAVKDYLRLKLQLLEHEEFHCIFLDNQHHAIDFKAMFRGTIDAASVYPREVVKAALQCNAAAVIFAHNHPSGLSEPSTADKTITSKLKEALGLIDVRVLDHFIVGDSFYSFAEHGLI